MVVGWKWVRAMVQALWRGITTFILFVIASVLCTEESFI